MHVAIVLRRHKTFKMWIVSGELWKDGRLLWCMPRRRNTVVCIWQVCCAPRYWCEMFRFYHNLVPPAPGWLRGEMVLVGLCRGWRFHGTVKCRIEILLGLGTLPTSSSSSNRGVTSWQGAMEILTVQTQNICEKTPFLWRKDRRNHDNNYVKS